MIVYSKISDPDRFGAYAKAVLPLIEIHGGHILGRSSPPYVLEGDWPWQGAMIFEYPTIEDAKNFWLSPQYAEVKKLREGAAEFQVILVKSFG